MKRQFRILKHQEFDRIIKGNRPLRTPNFLIYKEENMTYTRIGIAVSKKNGGAVTRVKIKRQIRAVFAERGDYSSPLNLIIVIKPSYDPERFTEAKEELNKALDSFKESQH